MVNIYWSFSVSGFYPITPIISNFMSELPMNCIFCFLIILLFTSDLWSHEKSPVNHHLFWNLKTHHSNASKSPLITIKSPLNHQISSTIHPEFTQKSPGTSTELRWKSHRHIRGGRRAAQLSVGPAPVAEANHQAPGRNVAQLLGYPQHFGQHHYNIRYIIITITQSLFPIY